MHDVFVVTSQNWDGSRISRIVYAADQDDARRTHRANFPDESIASVATRCAHLMGIAESTESRGDIAGPRALTQARGPV